LFATVDTATRVTRDIGMNVPLLASAMDTVTEGRMAIAMAQAGDWRGAPQSLYRRLGARDQAGEAF